MQVVLCDVRVTYKLLLKTRQVSKQTCYATHDHESVEGGMDLTKLDERVRGAAMAATEEINNRINTVNRMRATGIDKVITQQVLSTTSTNYQMKTMYVGTGESQ